MNRVSIIFTALLLLLLSSAAAAELETRGAAAAVEPETRGAAAAVVPAGAHGAGETAGADEVQRYGQQRPKKGSYLASFVDTLVGRVIWRAQGYNSQTPDYEAILFVRGDVDILKRNILMKAAPYLRRASSNKDNYYAEIMGSVTYTHPNIFNQKFKTINSNSQRFINEHIQGTVTPTLKLNVYSPYLYNGIYSPIAPKSRRYYSYSLDSLWHEMGITFYKISFTPKINNYKFVDGYFIVNDINWSVRRFHFKGKIEFIKFTNDIEMCELGTPEEFLTKRIDIDVSAKLLGNSIKGRYTSTLKYTDLRPSRVKTTRGRGKYDLTMHIDTQVDSLAPTPFRVVIKDTINNIDTVKTSLPDKNEFDFKDVGTFLVRNHSFNLSEYSQIKLSPLINPILFDFSSRNGISYSQRLRMTLSGDNERKFVFQPQVGYNFKYKDFYWRAKGDYNYSPRHMGLFTFDIGNGNKISTSRIVDELNSLPHIVFDSASVNLTDFNHIYAKFGHKIEVSNGFTIATNLAFHRYAELEKSTFNIIMPHSRYLERAQEIAKNYYGSFVPEIEFTYTPHQYYYYNGNSKQYLYSRFPTFSLNYAKAIKGVLNSTTSFNRVEFDVQQNLKIGPMRELSYRVGFGAFFDYNDLFFAEFNNLKRNNLPAGWDDDIGGTFQLLTSFKYNEIDKYLRANVKFDAPLLLVPSIFRNVKYIMKERLYCNLLLVDSMDPYIEMGYGIGTNIFNLGIFWGGEVTKWDTIGAKFTFEIFNN